MREQEHGEDNMILSGITGFVLGCAITVIYLNKRFNSIKALLTDKLLVNDLLKKEITTLTCCKDDSSKKAANKNKRRTYRRKPKKQLDK
jgi:hypothetical protein